MTHDRNYRLSGTEGECARCRDADSKAREGPWPHSGDHARDLRRRETCLGEALLDEGADDLGVTAGVARVARGENPGIAIDNGDAGAGGGVNREQHA
jgi:hypothetical protein